jgi:hypothetical protein
MLRGHSCRARVSIRTNRTSTALFQALFYLSDYWREWSAARTGLGRKRFVNLCEHHALPHAFVPELCPERGTCGIVYGLGYTRFFQRFRVHVAYEDCCTFLHQLGRFLVDSVLALVLDPGVDSLHATFLAGPVRDTRRPVPNRDTTSICPNAERMQPEESKQSA